MLAASIRSWLPAAQRPAYKTFPTRAKHILFKIEHMLKLNMFF